MDSRGRLTCKDIPDLLVLEVQRLYNIHGESWLVEKCGYPKKLVEAKMYRLVDQGLLDYGVSLRTAWITGLGHQMLKEAGL